MNRRLRLLRFGALALDVACILFPSSFSRVLVPQRPTTQGAEKKSGVPYIHMSFKRHRQTPESKHDEKTRHVGNSHVAQPSYSALILEIGDFLEKRHTQLRTLSPSPVSRLWRTFLLRRASGYGGLVALPRRCGGFIETAASLPYRRVMDNAPYLGGDRSARLTTGRYIKDQRPAVPR